MNDSYGVMLHFLQMAFFLSAVLVLGACDWVLVGDVGKQVFGIAILLGSGGSMALVTSLSMTADLINQNTVSLRVLPICIWANKNNVFQQSEKENSS